MINNIFKKYSVYYRISLALGLSGVGSALSQVAVYSTLQSWKVPPVAYVFAFALGIVPGIFASKLSILLANRMRLSSCVILFQVLGLLGVLTACVGSAYQSSYLLVATEFFAALSAGGLFPLINSLAKRVLTEDRASSIARWEGAMFGFQVLFGTLLGTLLFPFLGMRPYFAIDALSYGIALFVSISALRGTSHDISFPKEESDGTKSCWRLSTRREKVALLRLPVLALVATFSI